MTLFGLAGFGRVCGTNELSPAEPPPMITYPFESTPILVYVSRPHGNAGTLKFVIVSSPIPAIGATPKSRRGR